MEGRRRRLGAAAVPRRMVPSSSDHRPRIRRRCRSRRGCRRRRPGAGAAGRGYARRLVIRTGGSGRCLGVDRRVDRWLAARPRRVRRGSRGCGDRRSRFRRPGRGPWWGVSGGMDADGQRWSESGREGCAARVTDRRGRERELDLALFLVWRDSQIVVAVRSRVDAGDAGTRYVMAARSPASRVHVLPGATRAFA